LDYYDTLKASLKVEANWAEAQEILLLANTTNIEMELMQGFGTTKNKGALRSLTKSKMDELSRWGLSAAALPQPLAKRMRLAMVFKDMV
jgi:hypothetical protein